MASDRARVSYDPSRKWRGVIAQQGRVTVEADWNEAATIDEERDRRVTLDVVGPVGTPDGGYAVTASRRRAHRPAPPGDLMIGPGTLYVGGERLDLEGPVAYSAQPDWLDHSTRSALGGPGGAGRAGTSYELVYLLAVRAGGIGRRGSRPSPTSPSAARTPCSACASSSTSCASRPAGP